MKYFRFGCFDSRLLQTHAFSCQHETHDLLPLISLNLRDRLESLYKLLGRLRHRQMGVMCDYQLSGW